MHEYISVFESLYFVRDLHNSISVCGSLNVWEFVWMTLSVCLRVTIQVCVDGWVCVLVGE